MAAEGIAPEDVTWHRGPAPPDLFAGEVRAGQGRTLTVPRAALAEIEAALDRSFPTVQVQNQEELKDSISEQLDGLLGIVYALLLLSVLVSPLEAPTVAV